MNKKPARSALPSWVFLLSSLTTAASMTACTGAGVLSEPEPRDPYEGQWGMATTMGPNQVSAVMTLSYNDTGELVGTWESQGQSMDLFSISAEAASIQFEREIPGGARIQFAGIFEGEDLVGSWTGPFGELASSGKRDSINPFPDRHNRPIIEEDGYALLWANDIEDGEPEYFDVTDARIDPVTFQFGIGKDTIPSIDEPEFVQASDELLAERGVLPETKVLGVVLNGEARAYPVDIMSMHEVVNDEFSGEAYAVLW